MLRIDLYTKVYITILFDPFLQMHDRQYEKKIQTVEKFIKKHRTTDHLTILNEIDVDYDTLMKILADLSNKGRLK